MCRFSLSIDELEHGDQQIDEQNVDQEHVKCQ